MKHTYRIFFLALLFCGFAKSAGAIGHTVSITINSNVLCFGGCNGSAQAIVSGGVGPFLYSWSPSGQTTATATNLCAGQYTVTVTDQSDASTATQTCVVTQPPQITIGFVNVNAANCGNANGSACTSVSGGTPPYTFSWSPFGFGSCLTNAVAGNYFFTVTDANGCTNTSSVTIPNVPGPMVANIQSNPMQICNGGSAVLTPSVCCGTAPYTYNWSNPGFTLSNPTVFSPTASPSITTAYTFTITDAAGCSANDVVTVYVSPTITASLTTVDATCNQANGSVTANVTSGAPPYMYNWSNLQTSSVINNLTAGQYSVTVTDANGCTGVFSDGVSNIGGPSVSISQTGPSCANYSNGIATATPSGIAPFTYLWNSSPAQTTATASGLGPGAYMVTVTDSAGCVTVSNTTLLSLAGNFYLYATCSTPANCSMNTGSAYTVVAGGTAPYSYLWSSGDTTVATSGLGSGNQTISVTDANGCIASGTVNIPAVCGSLISGRSFIDINQNSNYDSGDVPIQGAVVVIQPGYHFAYTDAQGIYSCLVPNINTFTAVTNPPIPSCSLVYPAAGFHQIPFTVVGDTSLNNDFVYTAPTPFQDLHLSLASGNARPGFTQFYSIQCQNRGTTIVSDTIWFRHDSILTVSNAMPPFDGYSYPNGYWLFNNFGPGQYLNKYVTMMVPTIPNGGYLGRILISNARIEPMATDSTSPDNGDDEIDVITGSYDPNLKECYSPTMNEFGDIWPTDVELDYTIHFQNTGTDTAFTVVVVDTLPAELDITTFRMGASSHPCTYTINGYNGINEVKFTFMNILLVDSTTNEPASHGFCQFTIDRFPNLPIGTQILNEANNYFDFNPAIVTNLDTVTITNPLGVNTSTASGAFVYPNPAQDNVNILLSNEFAGNNSTVTLRDISGRTISTMQSNGATQLVLNTENCSAGMYFITIESSNQAIITRQLIISEK